jgi:hypothetical protein
MDRGNNMKTIALAVTFLAASQVAHAQEPLKVFGIGFNQPLNLPECETKVRDKLRMSRSEPKVKETYYTDIVTKGAGPCYQQNSTMGTGKLSDGTVRVLFNYADKPSLAQDNALYGFIVDGRMQRISVITRGFAFQDDDLAALTEKFGAPGIKEDVSQQNRMGANFKTIRAVWSLPDETSVVFLSAEYKINQGTIIVSNKAGDAAQKVQSDKLKDIINSGTKL